MEKLKNLPLYQKILLGGVLLIVLIFSLIPDKADQPIGDNQNAYEMNQSYPPSPGFAGTPNPVSDNRTDRVVLVDRSLQMPIGSTMVPPGWQLAQDIALNPGTGQYERYRLDVIGPNGQSLRTLNNTGYSQMEGTNFEQTWRGLVMNSVRGELTNFQIGALSLSTTLENDRTYREVSQSIRQQGMQIQPLEAIFTGERGGQLYRGKVYVVHMYMSHMMGPMGAVMVRIVMGPENLFAETLMIDQQVTDSYQPNPQYTQRVNQIHQQIAQNRQQDMQAMNQAHQQRMRDMRQGFDAQNQQWSENFFGSWNTGSSGASSGYNSNDQFLDAVTGHSTFDDPHTGYQRKVEGHYQYNFTDGMGNYYGTDDPNFNYRSLGNSWKPIDPLRPNN